ncbi:unnamed protein product [Echinostoma caproni]|uniref:Ion_trans domain-containing protein n=1 Tax=Echinostoma caproni TaxID=27848 RepID=A0A183AZT7_9TREM|nr:unnamed protein product [Echinostoma caproni]
MTVLNFTLWDVVRLTNALLLTRAARIVQLFTWTRLVAGVLRDLPRNLAPVLGIMATAYYVYALLGMNLFHGVIRFNPNTTTQYECGTYQQLEYWAVNFDDFAASLVLLWDLMVVNNWFVIVNAYQQALNLWVHVYMISWWILAPVGLLSLVTAFVIEVSHCSILLPVSILLFMYSQTVWVIMCHVRPNRPVLERCWQLNMLFLRKKKNHGRHVIHLNRHIARGNPLFYPPIGL